MPVILASQTELATVNNFLDRTKFAMTNMSQKHSVVVLDEAIYAIAQEILWKPENKDKYSGIVLRIGAFHVIRAFLSIIGKRFQRAGLNDLIAESGVVSNGSMAGIMAGKHFSRAI